MKGGKDPPDHRHNLLNPDVTDIGVAAVRTPAGSDHDTYWALILASPRPEPPPGGPFGTTGPVDGGTIVTFGGAVLPR